MVKVTMKFYLKNGNVFKVRLGYKDKKFAEEHINGVSNSIGRGFPVYLYSGSNVFFVRADNVDAFSGTIDEVNSADLDNAENISCDAAKGYVILALKNLGFEEKRLCDVSVTVEKAMSNIAPKDAEREYREWEGLR